MLTIFLLHFSVHFSRAHWYLAVICFPGLEGPCMEPNPHYQPQTQSQAQASSPSEIGSSILSEGGIEEPSPHTEPLSFNPEEVNTEAEGQDVSHSSMPSCPHRPPEHSCTHNQRVNGQVQSHYTGECSRRIWCTWVGVRGLYGEWTRIIGNIARKKNPPKLNINNGFFLVFKMLCEESVCVTAVKILAPSLMTKAPLM